jgi:hypothetical protein
VKGVHRRLSPEKQSKRAPEERLNDLKMERKERFGKALIELKNIRCQSASVKADDKENRRYQSEN